MQLTLPWPPSVNRYYRQYKGRAIISKEGREYRNTVVRTAWVTPYKTMTGLLSVSLVLYPPDRRRRNIDNILKALLDSMCKAGIYADDSQIKQLCIDMYAYQAPGSVVVTIEEIPPCAPSSP